MTNGRRAREECRGTEARQHPVRDTKGMAETRSKPRAVDLRIDTAENDRLRRPPRLARRQVVSARHTLRREPVVNCDSGAPARRQLLLRAASQLSPLRRPPEDERDLQEGPEGSGQARPDRPAGPHPGRPPSHPALATLASCRFRPPSHRPRSRQVAGAVSSWTSRLSACSHRHRLRYVAGSAGMLRGTGCRASYLQVDR
jgi:hypothetical protein